jgi:predicted ATPase
VRIGLLGGLRVEHNGLELIVNGVMQVAVLFRLAVDAGTSVSYRAISEDIWGSDAPGNTRASLQSIVSRLRSQLPAGAIESTIGGYRLTISRSDVDALIVADLVAAAVAAADSDEAMRLASEALLLWTGEPWTPSDRFDWFERDLRADRKRALELGGTGPVAVPLRHNGVPTPLTALIGRGAELEMIADQLSANRLVTIIGTGGAGKTRLAVEAAAREPQALLIELAPVGPGEVLASIQAATGRDLRTVEASESSGARERVLDALVGRDLLLVLDNCEHVIEEAAQVAEDLLGNLPRLRILATSREPLSILGEAFVAVGSLGHPGASDVELSHALLSFPAVELFRQRALAARGSDLDPSEIVIASRIAARLDGLPLALELAAAKLRTMSVQEVLDGLEHRFTLLTGGYRTALPRHQTLRAMIDWSWSLLTAEERIALLRLSVFPSGVDAADAAELAQQIGLSSSSVFDGLVDKSLLQRNRGRYRTLETIREYGLERLAGSGETAQARTIQARHLASRAREFDGLLRGPRITEAIAWFDAEEDNISAALRFAIAEPLVDEAVRLVTSCVWYWTMRDRGDDALGWFNQIAPLADRTELDEARILTVIGGAILAMAEADRNAGEHLDSMAIAIEHLAPIADMRFEAGSHELLQLFPPVVSAFVDVIGAADWMLQVRPRRGEDYGLDPWPTAMLHVISAAMAQNRGDVAVLGTESEIAVRQFTEVGDLWGLAVSEEMRAHWMMLHGRLDEALALTDDSSANIRRITSSWDLAQQQGLAISILARKGDFAGARERADRMIADAEASGSARAQLEAAMNAVALDLIIGDVATVGTRLTAIDELARGWPRLPPQMFAGILISKGGADMLRGDLGAAELHLREAADVAIESHDQPVIGAVAVAVGTLALRRGAIEDAVRAVELADALIGAHDATDPRIIAIMRAAAEHGIGRASAETPTRPKVIEALQRLVEY